MIVREVQHVFQSFSRMIHSDLVQKLETPDSFAKSTALSLPGVYATLAAVVFKTDYQSDFGVYILFGSQGIAVVLCVS